MPPTKKPRAASAFDALHDFLERGILASVKESLPPTAARAKVWASTESLAALGVNHTVGTGSVSIWYSFGALKEPGHAHRNVAAPAFDYVEQEKLFAGGERAKLEELLRELDRAGARAKDDDEDDEAAEGPSHDLVLLALALIARKLKGDDALIPMARAQSFDVIVAGDRESPTSAVKLDDLSELADWLEPRFASLFAGSRFEALAAALRPKLRKGGKTKLLEAIDSLPLPGAKKK